MTEVLLTHSYHLLYDPKQVRKMQPYPPLSTLYAAAVLRDAGISVAVFDTMLKDPSQFFPGALARHSPAVVAIYEDDFNFLSKMCLTRMRQVALEMIELSVRAGATVVVHGSDASDNALLYLQAGASYVLYGESEIRLRELVSDLLLKREPHAMCGIACLDWHGRLVTRAPQRGEVDWLDLPTPARDLIDLEPYRKAWKNAHGYFSLNMVASRGCPYRCNWCAKPISGNRFHVRPAKRVAAELLELQEMYDADHIWFGDDVFALDHRWMREFAEEIQKHRAQIPFKIQSRADLMSPGTVDALRRAGCAEVWMGVESGSQKVLDAMEKGLKVTDVVRARKALGRAGIRACYFLQFGYPGESWPEILQTIDLVRCTRPDEVGISVSYPLPNTRFYDRVQHQLGSKRNWLDSDDLCLTFTAAYTAEFYRAVRDALHAEVSAWSNAEIDTREEVAGLWQRAAALEGVSRNAEPTSLEAATPEPANLVSIGTLSLTAGER